MFGFNDTDREWKKWGEKDPFFAALTSLQYQHGRNKEYFLKTGEQYFDRLIQKFTKLSIPLDKECVALDYGCGVGRILRPMSKYFKNSVGIDISESMLQEARRNLIGEKAELRLFDGKNLYKSLSDSRYSFIHSCLVFQHIRPKRGMIILEQLLEHLEFQGKALIQTPIATNKKIRYFLNQILTSHPILYKLSNFLIKEREFTGPVKQMNIYLPDILIRLYDKLGIEVRGISLSTDSDNYLISASWYLYKS